MPFSAALAEGPSATQASRFEPSVDKILQAQTSESEPLRGMLDSDIRYNLFNLEVLLHIYKERYPDLYEFRGSIKDMEDRLGRTADLEKRIEMGKELGLPPAAIQFLEKQARESYSDNEKWMREHHWLPTDAKNPLQGLREELRKTKWDTYERDQALVRDELVQYIDDVGQTPYDLKQLQKGIHGLRKDLRKILTAMQALQNVTIDETSHSLPNPERYLTDKNAKKKYTALMLSAFEKDPIQLPKDALNALASIMKRFGDIKDIGEAQFEWIPEALLESGVVKSRLEASAKAAEYISKHEEYQEVFSAAAALNEELKSIGLLKVLHARCQYAHLAPKAPF